MQNRELRIANCRSKDGRACAAGTRPNWLFLALAASIGSSAVLGVALRSIAQEPTSPLQRAKILDQARAALVQVELYLKHSTENELEGRAGDGDTGSAQLLDRQQESVASFKQSVHLMGAILSPREVLVVDTGVDPRRIARWEVLDAAGRRVLAERTAVLADAPLLVLQPAESGELWKEPKYSDAAIDATSTLTVVSPIRSHLKWALSTTPAPPLSEWATGNSGEPARTAFWGVGYQANSATESENSPGGEPPATSASLVFSAAGDLLGVASADRIFADSAVPPWRGAQLKKAARIGWTDWEKTQDRLRDVFSNVMYPVRIEYRRPKGGAQAFPESDLLGWAISNRTLLIPTAIHRQIAARIDRVTVQVGGRDVEAQFLGQCDDFDAFLVQLPNDADALPAHSDLGRSATLSQYRFHAALAPARRFGQNDLRMTYTRPYGNEFGYGNRLSPLLSPAPPIGSLVCDLDGNPAGLFVRQRRPLEDLSLYERLTRSDPRQLALQGVQSLQGASSVEFFPIAQIAGVVSNPSTGFDPRVVRRTEKEQDRRVWLGIEFNPLTRDLAESLGCRKEAKDGTVGLMINQVYAGSPAEKVGLRPNDVLLWLEVPQRDHPVLLSPGRFGGPGGGRGAQAPWPSRENYMTNLLAALGENTPVKIRCWRDGKPEDVNVNIAAAPPDQDSAEQFKDEQHGITVKEVTYEVRSALRLKADDPGVVVAKIESGSSAGRARIETHEIIQAADGEPIDSPAKFESIVKKAQEDKKDQIRLTVVNRGRSRFADLKLGQ